MKICDLTQSYSVTSGGVRTYIHAKRAYIKNTCHEHILIVPGEKDEAIRDGNLTTYKVKGISVPHCQPYRFILRLDKVMRLLKIEKPDIVELGDAYLLPQAGFYCRRQFGSSVVGFYHTDFPSAYVEPVMMERFGEKVAGLSKKRAEQYARDIYSRCDATLTSTVQFTEKLQNLGVENVYKLYLGVDAELFHPKRRDENLRKQLGFDSEDIAMFYAGRLDGEKRIDLIVNAFEKIQDRFPGKLIIMGEGRLKPWVQEKAERNPQILFLPYLHNRQELARHMASADIYVTAGPHETFGLSVIEAQASGLCVLGVNGGALIERVPESLGVLSPVDCLDDMAENMLALSRSNFREKGSRAREWVTSHFTWRHTFEHLFQIYEDLSHQNEISRRKTA